MYQIDLHSALPWGAALVVILGLAALLILYGIWIRTLPRNYRYIILVLRGFFLAVVLLLILDPQVDWVRKVRIPPRIGVILDNSLSMANHPKASASTVFSMVATVVDWASQHDYESSITTFGERLIPRSGLRFEYQPDERLTDFGPLTEVLQAGDLQAGFLFSDGVATAGVDPGAIPGTRKVPVYAVGIGDTAASLDLSIVEVRYPLSLLEQEQGTITVSIKASRAVGRRSRLFIFHEDQLIHSEPVLITSQEHFQSFKAPVVGRLDAPRFRVELMVLPEEANIDNNRREFHIDVLPGHRQVTIITGGLSPNTSLISRVLKKTQHAIVDHQILLRGSWQGEEARFWSTPHDLVVLDNYPTMMLSEDHLDRLLAKIRREKSSVIIVAGPDNSSREFIRMMRSLGLPVEVEDDIQGVQQRLIPAPQPALDGLKGEIGSRYSTDFPPAALLYSLERESRESVIPILLDEDQGPVIGYGEIGGLKRSFFLLPALASTHLKLGRTGQKDYFEKVLQALVEWALESRGFSPYVIEPDNRQYHLGEKVLLRGIVRDRAGTKMLQPVLTVEIQSPEGTHMVTLIYNFETGEYEGEFWPGEPGSYRIIVYEDEGASSSAQSSFQVQVGRIELESLAQNRYGLERLAQSTGGRYTDLKGLELLLAGLSYTSKTVPREYHFSLWRIPFLWLGLVLILGVEWSIRRIAGLI